MRAPVHEPGISISRRELCSERSHNLLAPRGELQVNMHGQVNEAA